MTLLLANWKYVVIAALLALLGLQTVRISALKTEQAEYVLESEKAARIAVEQAIAEQSRRQQAYDEEAQNARAEKAELESTVAQLADAADGLRGDLANFTQRAKSNACATCRSAGKPGADPGDLLSELYLRSVRANQELAEFADRLEIAGSACERAADALSSAQK